MGFTSVFMELSSVKIIHKQRCLEKLLNLLLYESQYFCNGKSDTNIGLCSYCISFHLFAIQLTLDTKKNLLNWTEVSLTLNLHHYPEIKSVQNRARSLDQTHFTHVWDQCHELMPVDDGPVSSGWFKQTAEASKKNLWPLQKAIIFKK